MLSSKNPSNQNAYFKDNPSILDLGLTPLQVLIHGGGIKYFFYFSRNVYR